MKYRCITCDHVFEHEGGDKPRCPRCLGIHDVEPVAPKPDKQPAATPQRRKPHPWIVAAVVVAIAVGGYFAYTHKQKGGGEGEEPVLAPDDLRAALVRAGVPDKDIVLPFEVTDAIRAFAAQAAGGRDDEEALEALVGALAEMKKQGKWTPHHQRTPRLTEPLPAGALLAELQKKRAEPYQATSYELACLLLAAARAVDVDAHLAQIFAFEGVKAPADSAGRMGRYGVVFGKGTPKEPAPLFDPYELRTGKAARAEVAVLGDQQAVAPFYAHRSLALLQSRKSADALASNDLAIKLDAQCPTFRSGRGLIFLASGAVSEAIAEFEKAVKRRDDAVAHTNLAEVLAMTDYSGERSKAELEAALAKMPDYARPRAALAAIYASQGEFEAAEGELTTAERLAPDSPDVAFAWAGYYAAKHDGDQAIAKGLEAVRLAGEDLDTLMSLAGIYSAVARFDGMRATLDKVLARFDSPEIEELVEKMFGYNPKAAVASEGNADAGVGGGGLGELQLNMDKPGGPSLLGSDGLKLGPGLGGGMGGGLGGGGLGGGQGAQGSGGLKLKYDMNN
jgi:tetratricopeptide (TPR) repeat protein